MVLMDHVPYWFLSHMDQKMRSFRRPFCGCVGSVSDMIYPDVINVLSYEGFITRSPYVPVSHCYSRSADLVCFVFVQQASLFIDQRASCVETYCIVI
jgi:hypothetical protein